MSAYGREHGRGRGVARPLLLTTAVRVPAVRRHKLLLRVVLLRVMLVRVRVREGGALLLLGEVLLRMGVLGVVLLLVLRVLLLLVLLLLLLLCGGVVLLLGWVPVVRVRVPAVDVHALEFTRYADRVGRWRRAGGRRYRVAGEPSARTSLPLPLLLLGKSSSPACLYAVARVPLLLLLLVHRRRRRRRHLALRGERELLLLLRLLLLRLLVLLVLLVLLCVMLLVRPRQDGRVPRARRALVEHPAASTPILRGRRVRVPRQVRRALHAAPHPLLLLLDRRAPRPTERRGRVRRRRAVRTRRVCMCQGRRGVRRGRGRTGVCVRERGRGEGRDGHAHLRGLRGGEGGVGVGVGDRPGGAHGALDGGTRGGGGGAP